MASDDVFRVRIPVRFPAPRVPDAEEFDTEGTAGELAGGIAIFGLGLIAVAGAGWMLAGGLGTAGLAVLFFAAFLAWPERVGIGVFLVWFGAFWLAGMIAFLVLGVIVFMVSPVLGWIMFGAWVIDDLNRSAAELAAERAVARRCRGAPDV